VTVDSVTSLHPLYFSGGIHTYVGLRHNPWCVDIDGLLATLTNSTASGLVLSWRPSAALGHIRGTSAPKTDALTQVDLTPICFFSQAVHRLTTFLFPNISIILN